MQPVKEDIIVKLDQLRLQQVIINLLSNAVKFSKHGDTVKVEILVYDLLEDSDKVELEIKVEDSGLGIYPEDLKNLF